MPIKDKSQYPDNWDELRAQVLKRANNCCEICGVPNYSLVARSNNGTKNNKGESTKKPVFQFIDQITDMPSLEKDGVYDADTGELLFISEFGGTIPTNPNGLTKIILTVAHLDQNTHNNDLGNLKALCQYHHLKHDRETNISKSKATRTNKKQVLNLFESER